MTVPGYVIKLNRNTLQREARVAAGQRITSMASDNSFVYIADYESPARIVKIRKSDMSIVQTSTLLDGENQIAALVASPPHIYIGTDTSPAHIIQYTGMLVAGDCVMNEWTNYGPCDKSCGTGKQTRTRSIRIPAVHGGKPCPTSLSMQSLGHLATGVGVGGGGVGFGELNIDSRTAAGRRHGGGGRGPRRG